jgi:hypothetical protein
LVEEIRALTNGDQEKRKNMLSLEAKLNEALEKMTSKQRDKFYESRKSGSPIEVQLNCAEAVLAGKVKESAPVRKHNGVNDNGGTEFRESAGITEPADIFAKGDGLLYKGLGISEGDQRRLMELPPVGTNLTPTQLREFRFLRGINLSEADAVRGALRIS